MFLILFNIFPRLRLSIAAAATIHLVTLLTLYSSTVESAECPASFSQSVNCSCARMGLTQYDLLCPRSQYPHNSYALKADIEENKHVSLSCSIIKSPADLTLVSGLNVGPVESFIFKLCPLPEGSFRDLMLSMGIKQVKKLQVQLVLNFSTIEKRHLEGLNEVTQLDLSSIGLKELQEDLFKDMSNLTWLTLINNNINHLPKGIFRYLPKLKILDLGSNNISFLEPGIFRNLSQLRLLTLWSNRIANLTRSVFSDTPNLEILDLHSNSLVTLTPDVFTDLAKLKSINILGNKLTALPKGLFSSNPSLETFTLTNNKKPLNAIPQAFLSNLKSLKEVTLSNSNITALPKDFIWGSPNINKILLSGNLLEELPEDLFRDSSEVTMIDISNNRLKMLSDSMFISTTELKTLLAHHNQLRYLSRDLFIHLEELEKLDFSYNELIEIDSEAFLGNINLQVADFSHNYLTLYNSTDPFVVTNIFGPPSPFRTCIRIKELRLANNLINQVFHDWLAASDLTLLDLKHNKISYIEARELHFRSKQNLRVDLSFNAISVINLHLMETIALAQYTDGEKIQYPLENHSTKINLNGNPLQCDCRNYDLKNYFDSKLTPEVNYIIDLESFNLTCAGPKPLEGMLFNEIKSEVLLCPIHKIIENSNSTCPDKCECFYKPYNHGLIVDCNKRNLTSIPDNFLLGSLKVLKKLNRLLNHTELDLSENFISSLPRILDDGFKNVTQLTLSSNNFTNIDLSILPPNITVLKLDGNNISNLDFQSSEFLTNARQLQLISLQNNPWRCDCQLKDFLGFTQIHFDKVDKLANVTCVGGKPISELTVNDICPFSSTAVVISSISIAIFGLIIGLFIALYYRFNQEIKVWLYAHQICLWFVTEEELDRDKLYDAFVSFSHQDQDFVIKHIVPGLENGPRNFKLCLHYRDWVVGDYIPTQITRSVENSRRTIVILSPSFLDSVWGKMEFRTAHKQALDEGRARVIVILYGDIGPTDKLDPELKAYISMNTYIKWGDPWFWDRLRFALPHPPKPVKGIPLFQRNLVSQQNRPVLKIDKDDLIKDSDPNATPPAATTPPANTFMNETLSFIPNGQPKFEESSDTNAKVKY